MNGSINLPEEDNKTQLLFPEEDLEEGDQEVRLKEAKTKAKAKHKEKKRKSKEEKKKERENKQRKRLWDDIFDLDYYSLFKQFGPIIPTLPSIYAIVRSMFVDTSNSSLANWYKVFDFMENLNICLYSIAATVFYKIFQKKKKEEEELFKKKKKKEAKDQVRMRFADNVRRLNTIFLVFCFLVSGVKLVLGILLAPLDKVPDDQPKGLFYFYLISKLGLILAQLFYLYTVYVKKYYKARPILDDAADNGIVDDSNGEKKKDDTDPDKKDDDDDPNKKKDDDPGKKDDKDKEKDKDKKKEKEEKKEDKEKEDGRSQQDQENFEKVLHTMEENNKFNEKLLSKLEDMDELNQNWTEVKKELSMIKRQNLVLLKFSKPLMEDVELKILNQTDKAENQSFVIHAKIYESVKDVKQKIAEKLSLGKTVKVDLKTSQGELKDDGLIGEFDLDHLKQGLLLNYYEGN